MRQDTVQPVPRTNGAELRVETNLRDKEPDWPLDQPPAWRDVVNRIHEFPNLESVYLRFGRFCWANGLEYGSDWVTDDEGSREKNVKLRFGATAKVNGLENRHIAKMTVGSPRYDWWASYSLQRIRERALEAGRVTCPCISDGRQVSARPER